MNSYLPHVAVIGAGPAGLAAMKCLQEEGFSVTGFERRSDAGGLWTFSDNPNYTSVTTGTKAQLSKFVSCYTDFPFPDDFPVHPAAADLSRYYRLYAKHFGIYDKIIFNVSVSSIRKSCDGSSWMVQLDGEEHPRTFDKVVLATGTEVLPRMPEIEGIHNFQGKFIHGQAYKRPQDFSGKNVVVLGQGNSAADCAVELTRHAARVHLAHRRGANVFGRHIRGQRFDKCLSWRLQRSIFFLERRFPRVQSLVLDPYYRRMSRRTFGEQDPKWRLGGDEAPSMALGIAGIIVNDELVPALRSGKLRSAHGIRRVLGPRTVEFDDGSVLENVDAIIACTGYKTSFSILGDAISYSQPPTDSSSLLRTLEPLPNLYHNIFPVDHAESLAVLNYCIVMDNAATTREIMSMAVAQVWSGKHALPPPEDMRCAVASHHAWLGRRAASNPLTQYDGVVEPHSWLRAVNDMAGTGVYEHLGPNLRTARFALREPRMWWLMSFGVCSPHMYRVFETGKRPAWEGARDALLYVNEQSDINLGKKTKALS